jgi:Mg-chelatase subunit ChlD
LYTVFTSATVDCTRTAADVVFVIDNSGSIRDAGEDNYDMLKDFMIKIVKQLRIGPNNYQVGVVRFSTSAEHYFYLNQHSDVETLVESIKKMPYIGGHTNTSGGLRLMKDEQFQAKHGDRPGARNIGIVITDGKSTYDANRTIPDANAAKQQGVQLYSIGVTNAIDEEELKDISSDPKMLDQNYFISPNFTALSGFIDQIVKETCSLQTGMYNYTED